MEDYSILGIDIGNATTCVSGEERELIIDSKVSLNKSLSKCDCIEINGSKYYIGEGDFNTTYRKVDKKIYIPLLIAAIALVTDEVNNNIVLGLPISQYNEDKSLLINKVMANREYWVKLNDAEKHICINDIEVFPEGIFTAQDDFEGVVVDVGGRTVDCAKLENRRGKRKITNPISLPVGTINLYNDFIKELNKTFLLDLNIDDAERILKNGLYINGELKNISKPKMAIEEFANNIINKLQIEYPLSTCAIHLTGGGASIIYESIKKSLGNVTLQQNGIMANARAFKELGYTIWE